MDFFYLLYFFFKKKKKENIDFERQITQETKLRQGMHNAKYKYIWFFVKKKMGIPHAQKR